MADGTEKSEEEEKKEEEQKKEADKELQNVCDLSIPSIIAALHQKALAAASSKVSGILVANSAIESDGKTAKLKSAGEHIISILPDSKDEGATVTRANAVTALKEYVHWFVGPDLEAKVKDDVVMPLGETGEVDSNEDTEDEDDEDSSSEENVNASMVSRIPSFLQFLNEANDEDGEDDGTEGASDEEADNGVNASAKDDTNDEDSAQDGEDETADDSEETKGLDASDNSKKEEAAPGYYIAYNLKVQGLKETALKDAMKKFAATFFDDVTIKADGLFGGGDSLSVKQVKDAVKSVFGSIDPEKLKRTILDKLSKKFPDLGTTANVEIRDKNTLVNDLKSFKLDSKDKDKILKANYSVTIEAEKSAATKKFLNLRTIADLVTSSIQGLFKKFKNQIKKDDVILVKDYEDPDQTQKERDKMESAEKKKIKSQEQFEKMLGKIKDKSIDSIVAACEEYFIKGIEADINLKKSTKAKTMVDFWKKFKKDNDGVHKFSDYLANLKSKYAEVCKEVFKDEGSSDDSDEFGESMTSISLISKPDIQKMILEMLFEDFSSSDLQPDQVFEADDEESGEDAESGEGEGEESGGKDDEQISKAKDQLKASASSTFGDNEFKCNVLSREDTITQLGDAYKDIESKIGEDFSHCLVVDFNNESKLKESFNDKVKQYLKLLFEADKQLITKDNAQKCFDAALNGIEVEKKGDVIELTLKRDIEAESIAYSSENLILESDDFIGKVKKYVTSDAVDLGKTEMKNPKLHNSYLIQAGKSDDVVNELEKIGIGNKDDYEKMREKQFSVYIPVKQPKDVGEQHFNGSHGAKAFTEDSVKKLFKDNLGDIDFTYQVLTGTSTTIKCSSKIKEPADMKVFVASFDEGKVPEEGGGDPEGEKKEYTIRFFDSSKEDFNDASKRKLLKPEFKVKNGKTIKDMLADNEQANDYWNDGPTGDPSDWEGGKWCDKDGNQIFNTAKVESDMDIYAKYPNDDAVKDIFKAFVQPFSLKEDEGETPPDGEDPPTGDDKTPSSDSKGSGNDLYIIPMPGLKYPDEDEE